MGFFFPIVSVMMWVLLNHDKWILFAISLITFFITSFSSISFSVIKCVIVDTAANNAGRRPVAR